jgi:putative peptidoglycan lipid II flippase
VPLATSVYPGLSERADRGDEAGYAAALAPTAVLTLVSSAVAAAALVAVSGPMARVFLASDADAGSAVALQPTIAAFAPGLLGYGLVALLSRALYARGLWRAPTVCVAGGWLAAVAADLVLTDVLPAADRALALGAGHSIGVTVAGVALLAVVARESGTAALAGVARTGLPALLAGLLGGAAGLLTARVLGADPVPEGGVPAAIGIGLLAGGVVLLVAAAVMMGTSRRPLLAAVQGLRRSGRQEEVAGV